MTAKQRHNEYMKAYTQRRKQEDPAFAARVRAVALKSYHKHSSKRATRHKLRRENGVCVRCGKCPPLDGLTACSPCSERVNARAKQIVQTVLDHYGSACACCGESNPFFLTLDHINGDGAAHRKANGGHNYKYYIYKRAKDTGIWPDDLRTLCYNCNCGRERNGGICPHQANAAA